MTPEQHPHGSRVRYEMGRCRCTECRAGNTRRNRVALVRRIDAVPFDLLPHGRVDTYKNFACRCLACTSAASAAVRRYRARRS